MNATTPELVQASLDLATQMLEVIPGDTAPEVEVTAALTVIGFVVKRHPELAPRAASVLGHLYLELVAGQKPTH